MPCILLLAIASWSAGAGAGLCSGAELGGAKVPEDLQHINQVSAWAEDGQRMETPLSPSTRVRTSPQDAANPPTPAAHQPVGAALEADFRSIPTPAKGTVRSLQPNRPRVERVDTLLAVEPVLEKARQEPRAHPNTP